MKRLLLFLLVAASFVPTATYANEKTAKQTHHAISMTYPLRRIKITCNYGYRKDPFTGKRAFHNGLDLRANYEPTYAMMPGYVLRVGQDLRSGKFVVLSHGNFTVSYCHLSKIALKKGDRVECGDMVAWTGNTGRSTGPHLHLGVKYKGQSFNPTVLLYHIATSRGMDIITCQKALATSQNPLR